MLGNNISLLKSVQFITFFELFLLFIIKLSEGVTGGIMTPREVIGGTISLLGGVVGGTVSLPGLFLE